MSWSDWLTSLVSWGALASSLVAIAGFLFVQRQVRQSERSLLGSTSQFCYQSMSALLMVLIDKPHLRPYLYENRPLPPPDEDGELRQQVLALAAHYADFFDALLLQDLLGNVPVHEYISVWKGFIQDMLTRNAVIRQYCVDHPTWYSPELLALAERATKSAQPTLVA